MSIRPSMFGSRKGQSRKRNSHAQSGSVQEVDLREEMDCILYGEDGSPRHGNLVLIRRMRRDADGYPTKCNCMKDQVTYEADPDCSYCYGEGYLWDEKWAWAFWQYAGADSGFVRRYVRMAPGEMRVDYKIFYFRYDTEIDYGDKIVEVKLDADGNVKTVLDDSGNTAIPYTRESIYKPQTLAKRRADNGRIEYIAAYCREDDALRLDAPQ